MAQEALRGPVARKEGLVVEEIGDQLLVYDFDRDKAHRLSETAAMVFRLCNGERDVAALATLLSEQSRQEVDKDLVARALHRLADEHLVEGPFSSGDGLSRRAMLQKAGVAGAAGLAVPVVSSILAPPAAAQASCAPQGTSCDEPNSGCPNPTVTCCPPFSCGPATNGSGACVCR